MTPQGSDAVGYIRVSTRMQGDSGHGLDAQEDAIRVAAQRHGWRLSHIEREVISSRRKRRPGLESAMETARECAGVLVASKASRIARSTMELLQLHDRAERERWHLITLDMEHLDLSTPFGKLGRTMLAAFAEFERDMVSERTIEAMAAAKERGAAFGRPRSLRADTVVAIRELRSDGNSYQRIADTLNEHGIPGAHGGRWYKRSVQLALQRYGA